MIWKIIFLLTCLDVLVIAPRTDQDNPREEYLEELFNEEILNSINSVATLSETNVDFDYNDVILLSVDCYTDENCLNNKKESVKKYHQKMQAIQCVNGLFVLKVLYELKAIMYSEKSSNINLLKKLLQKLISKHTFYLTCMMSLLNMAKWDAYSWQIEMFTFVEGLAALDTNLQKYKDHFMDHNVAMQDNVLAFVSRCVEHKYLVYLGNKTPRTTTISRLVDTVYSQMELMYSNGSLDVYGFFEHYTVPNLMLKHLYSHHHFIFDWSNLGINLETSVIERQLTEYVTLYSSPESLHLWELDPIGGNKYNALIAKCIHLKVVFFTWLHLYTYHDLLNRPIDDTVEQFMRKGPLVQIWHTFVFPLKRALRTFRFEENIYWSAIRFMMVDLKKNSKQELAAREEFTRNYFCQAVEDLGLAAASDIDQQLKKIKIAEEHGLMYAMIQANAFKLDDFTDAILRALNPLDGTFIRLIVSAEGNETFVTH